MRELMRVTFWDQKVTKKFPATSPPSASRWIPCSAHIKRSKSQSKPFRRTASPADATDFFALPKKKAKKAL